jgi:chromosome segregation ATPase
MSSDQFFDELKNENDQLQKQLDELEYLIQIKEEELELLRKESENLSELKSKIQMNLYEFEQMQLHILEHQKKAVGAIKRETMLEEELFQNIKIETEYYKIKEDLNSTKTALEDINHQMSEAVLLYKQVADLKSKITELESNLEIAELDKQFLKEEIDEIKNARS